MIHREERVALEDATRRPCVTQIFPGCSCTLQRTADRHLRASVTVWAPGDEKFHRENVILSIAVEFFVPRSPYGSRPHGEHMNEARIQGFLLPSLLFGCSSTDLTILKLVRTRKTSEKN